MQHIFLHYEHKLYVTFWPGSVKLAFSPVIVDELELSIVAFSAVELFVATPITMPSVSTVFCDEKLTSKSAWFWVTVALELIFKLLENAANPIDYLFSFLRIAACAAASRAIGTRYGEQET